MEINEKQFPELILNSEMKEILKQGTIEFNDGKFYQYESKPMDKNTYFEVSGCSNAVLSLEWNYTRCRGVLAMGRLYKRIKDYADSQDSHGEITINYWQPRRNKQKIIMKV